MKTHAEAATSASVLNQTATGAHPGTGLKLKNPQNLFIFLNKTPFEMTDTGVCLVWSSLVLF